MVRTFTYTFQGWAFHVLILYPWLVGVFTLGFFLVRGLAHTL